MVSACGCNSSQTSVSTCGSNSSWISSEEPCVEPSQSILFLDWDDTVFPTTLLFEDWGVSPQPEDWRDLRLSQQQLQQLDDYREALMAYLLCCCSVFESCVVVTNAQRGWVHDSVDAFVPELRVLLDAGAVRVAYAREGRRASKTARPVRYHEQNSYGMSPDEARAHFTFTKAVAMRKEVKRFCAAHPGQGRKNVVSIGDASYEQDALQELALADFPECHGGELCFKAIRTWVPDSLSQFAVLLTLHTAILRPLLAVDADFAVDLASVPKAARFDRLMATLGLPGYEGVMTPVVNEDFIAEAVVHIHSHLYP